MGDTENAEIAKRTREAHQALSFQQDMSRLIDAKFPVSHRIFQPLKERKIRNHFTKEYEDLWRGNRHDSTASD
jgi:hypothetical protein